MYDFNINPDDTTDLDFIKTNKFLFEFTLEEKLHLSKKDDCLFLQFQNITKLTKNYLPKIRENLFKHFQSEKKIVFDLEGITIIDDKFLEFLVLLQNQLSKRNIKLQLINPSNIIKKILHITELDRLLIIKSEESNSMDSDSSWLEESKTVNPSTGRRKKRNINFPTQVF